MYVFHLPPQGPVYSSFLKGLLLTVNDSSVVAWPFQFISAFCWVYHPSSALVRFHTTLSAFKNQSLGFWHGVQRRKSVRFGKWGFCLRNFCTSLFTGDDGKKKSSSDHISWLCIQTRNWKEPSGTIA
jgi:hypothetical protein